VSHFHLFVYGTLRTGASAADLLAGCERVGAGTLHGTLYDIGGRFPALLPYGSGTVHGEVRRCPAELLARLDSHEGTAAGLFRRIAGEVETSAGERVACWVYTAGPALAHELTPERRIEGGEWHVPAPGASGDEAR
jgi:gamma-glutamylcyclotransferase (GGCT)/AIG2-like uncharacterized protein YtfP